MGQDMPEIQSGFRGEEALGPNCEHLLDTGMLQSISEECYSMSYRCSKAFDCVGDEKLRFALKGMEMPDAKSGLWTGSPLSGQNMETEGV